MTFDEGDEKESSLMKTEIVLTQIISDIRPCMLGSTEQTAFSQFFMVLTMVRKQTKSSNSE